MNILFITHHDNFQGSSRSLLSLLEGLRPMGITPFILNPQESNFTEALKERGFKCQITPIPWWVDRHSFSLRKKISRLQEMQRSVKTIRKYIREWNIDLVYTNVSVIPVGILAAKLEGKPHVWHIREYRDLHFGWSFIFSDKLSRCLIQHSDAIICNSKALKAYYFNSCQRNVHQVYNGAATLTELEDRLDKRRKLTTHDPFTFSVLSALSAKKGQEQAIRAMAALKKKGVSARLLLAGNGRADYIAALHRMIEGFDLSKEVRLLGLVEEPLSIHFQSDCGLICSEAEVFSRAGLEAMSTALPLIGKRSGGNPELIRPGETGFLYDSFEDLVKQMEKMASNPTLARQMGQAGWESSRDNFTIEQYSSKVYQVIQLVSNQA